MPHLFLTGYEQETIEEFINKLKINHITTVIDIREIPLSRKNGFSKNRLAPILNANGIKYYHLPQFGSPSEIRNDLKSGRSDYLEFFKKYRKYIQGERSAFKDLFEIINNNGKTTLLCYEKDSDLCHRSILANEILKRDKNLTITPL
ncbi:hypothetical protein A2Z00_05760 [Candidatus Gottesmanbacteria bacterium RBG_13_45_10]|uniref:DUF488 domain-containing protein n=1 Tax=Candidatus Gottesmanbacteria bacterium RBG_13_45_10 TaxID=1798370 RepID=A0A1F5ZGI2_9BACT|nr:MAG: hypothetical protein A2Z00_05760 [Candidatus Gottesmanbacteria bacterium RBG_13_45_10]